ncbi:MAG: extracellular solute-binding protein [Gammaproteobacteria bacterium]
MLIYTGFHPLTVVILVLIAIYTNSVQALPSMGMGYEPKYPADFKHFDYINPDAPKAGKLVLAGTGSFDSFNPYILKGNSAEGLNLVFDTLMVSSKDEPFSKYPLIAEDISLANDRLSVTFRINKKARFSNGDAITADDVKFSFDTIMSDKAHPQFRFIYGDVKRAVKVNKYSIRFEFNRANPELHLILGDIPVFSEKWLQGKSFDKLSEEIPIASGPYTVASYSLGKQVMYQRDTNYWAAELPSRKGQYNFDQVVYKYYQDLVISLEAFKAGEFDFRFEYYSKLWAREHEGPNYVSGKIKKELLPHKNNAGMQGFLFNTRRDMFKDPRVRQAIALGFDFEWSNDHLFYNQYVSNDSYFSNTELAASSIPEGDELKLLEPYRDQLPEALFTQPWQPVTTLKPSSLRKNLRKAKVLLEQAGWTVKDGVLTNDKGQLMQYEVMLAQKGFDRILAPFARNLAKLGIHMTYRLVDRSLYIRSLREFDYDMVVGSFSQSLSPGNELLNMFHSQSAQQSGSQNYIGIENPVVDALVEKIISASNRNDLITACRALDRVLLHGYYLVPNFYINKHRIAYWDKFSRPQSLPLYYSPIPWLLESWWVK